MKRIGIDLGGTKIEAILMCQSGVVEQRARIATPTGDYRASLAALAGLIDRLDPGAHTPVGICTPGSLSPGSGLLRNSNSVCLNDKPFVDDLEAITGRKIRIANDANCFALSESRDGAGSGVRVVFGAILGTGVGGGIVVDGRILNGANAIAGEWGHNPLPWPETAELPGAVCYCGKSGCIETWISGPGMARDHGGEGVTAQSVAHGARRGDPDCRDALQRYERRLAKCLAHIINVLDPDVIVLGGGLSNIEPLYRHVPALWSEYVFSDVVNTRLLPAQYGDASGVRGAAWLWSPGG
jgi:fructokinase